MRVLPVSPGDPGLSSLLEESFPGSLYRATFPQVYRSGTLLGAWQGASLVCCLSLTPTSWGPLRALGVGSVTTRGTHRGRGIAGLLLEAAKAHAQEGGYSFLYLYSGLPTLYERAGFSYAGWDSLVPHTLIPRGGLAHVSPLPVQDEEISDLFSTWNAHRLPQDSDLSLAQFRLLMTIPRMELLSYPRHNPHTIGFLGKGADFPSTVHGVRGPGEGPAQLVAGLEPPFQVLWDQGRPPLGASRQRSLLVCSLSGGAGTKEVCGLFAQGSLLVRSLWST